MNGRSGSERRRRSVGSLTAAFALALSPLTAPLAAAASNDPGYDRQWALGAIGAERAWAVGRGAGVTIAIIDTGVHLAHEDLSAEGKLVQGLDYVDTNTPPQDENGHGTHVAGIAAGVVGNGRGIAGVAPDARIMPIRVLDENGTCVGSCAVADAVRWAADRGARVINLSLGDVGQQVFGPSFGSALEYAWAKGSIPVVAAGNDFLLSSGYDDHPALVVAATDRYDRKPDFSSGVGSAKWGISAPGGGSSFDPLEDDVYSTDFDPGAPGANNSYTYRRGTSQAAPHVTGAAAVLLSLGLDAQRTVDRLLETAKDIGPPGRDPTFGRGRLDLAKAVEGLGTQSSGVGSGPAAAGTASGPGGSPAGGASAPSGPSEAAATKLPSTAAPPRALADRRGVGSSPGGGTDPVPVAADEGTLSEPTDDTLRSSRQGYAVTAAVVVSILAGASLAARALTARARSRRR